jgi:SAM-dependent methyltransferase
MSIYDGHFQQAIVEGSLRSARRVVPIVAHLLQVQSVIDIGCGLGAWLQAWAEQGVEDLLGIDGTDPECSHIRLTTEQFVRADLNQPIQVDRRFDLAMCLEVAEHLPEERAEGLIYELCQLADTVLFSAAIPGQGGTGHQNEQWPDYWACLFETHSYSVEDSIRRQIWNDDGIDYWYRQNLVVARKSLEVARERPLPLVHPRLLERALSPPARPTLREVVNELPGAFSRWVSHYRRIMSTR